jgi:hypothetical protein
VDQPQRVFAVPESEPVELVHHGLPLDAIEDLLPQSPAYRQARRILFAPEAREKGRPLTPLHQGHVALLATSGLLDGTFGEGDLRHIARWQAVKTVLRLEEEDENGVTTIREKEQFSHCLNLLYADGRTAVLTNDSPQKEKDEKAARNETADQSVSAETYSGIGRKFRLDEVRDEERA